jgi:hypothetical protein
MLYVFFQIFLILCFLNDECQLQIYEFNEFTDYNDYKFTNQNVVIIIRKFVKSVNL